MIDVEKRRPAIGFGSGGLSGAALLPVGVLAAWKVSRAVKVPIIGVGGIRTAEDVVQYLLAGATLVAIGTAALISPRVPEQVVRDLTHWFSEHGIRSPREIIGTLEWPS